MVIRAAASNGHQIGERLLELNIVYDLGILYKVLHRKPWADKHNFEILYFISRWNFRKSDARWIYRVSVPIGNESIIYCILEEHYETIMAFVTRKHTFWLGDRFHITTKIGDYGHQTSTHKKATSAWILDEEALQPYTDNNNICNWMPPKHTAQLRPGSCFHRSV